MGLSSCSPSLLPRVQNPVQGLSVSHCLSILISLFLPSTPTQLLRPLLHGACCSQEHQWPSSLAPHWLLQASSSIWCSWPHPLLSRTLYWLARPHSLLGYLVLHHVTSVSVCFVPWAALVAFEIPFWEGVSKPCWWVGCVRWKTQSNHIRLLVVWPERPDDVTLIEKGKTWVMIGTRIRIKSLVLAMLRLRYLCDRSRNEDVRWVVRCESGIAQISHI